MTYKSLELSKPQGYELEGLEVGVTSNCNFRCDYCCAYQRNDGEHIGAREIIRVIDDLPTLKRVRLSGGEVTLKFQDCLETIAHCASKGIATQLNTNASLLDRDKIRRLHEAGLTNIHISFNFTSADQHAAYYRLSPAIFHKIVENIRLCVETGIETVLETLLFAETQHRMLEINRYIYDLGVRIHEIQNGISMQHTGWNAIAARDDLVRAVTELIEHRPEDMTLIFTCMDRFADRLGFQDQPGVHFVHCIEGFKQLHVHGNGDILISELCRPVVIGNIYNGTSLRRIYRDMPAALADYLAKRPCPALNALFPEEGTAVQ